MEQRVPSEQEAKYINKAYGVNDIFEKVSESADTIKKDFKKGYEEN